MSFRYPCYRRFKSHMGNLIAVHEVIELAVYAFEDSVTKASDTGAFIREQARKYGMFVNLPKCPQIRQEVMQSQIMNIHKAFDAFHGEFRSECTDVIDDFGKWKDYDNKSHLDVTILNVFKNTPKLAIDSLGKMQIDVCDYYRHMRNEAAHLENNHEQLKTALGKATRHSAEIQSKYKELRGSAPNLPAELTRDDVQLFARTSLDVAWRLCQKMFPSDAQFARVANAKLVDERRKFSARPERITRAVTNFLRLTYGLDDNHANRIAEMAQ